MTWEQQRKLKELRQALPQMLKDNAKIFQLKKKDYMLWSVNHDIYGSLLIDVREQDGHCYCISQATIKPLWMDELLWDIMDMAENKAQPLSQRCIGAFAIHGMKVSEAKQELLAWEKEELEQVAAQVMKHFSNTIKCSTCETYRTLLDPAGYQGEVQQVLTMIHDGREQEALTALDKMQHGECFVNQGMSFRERAIQYCKNRMGQR